MYYIKLKEKVGIVGCRAETGFDCLLQPLLLFFVAGPVQWSEQDGGAEGQEEPLR